MAARTAPDGRRAKPDLDRVALQSETLYAVIGVVASAPDLDRVLDGIVDLLSEATDCHACFVYLRDGDRLRLRAASRVYAHLVGRVEMGLDEGLAGWVARNGTARVHPRPRAGRPAHEVRSRRSRRSASSRWSRCRSRRGRARRWASVVLHTVAPREFDEGVLTFLAHTASLVAGAIENARLYEDTRRRVEALTAAVAASSQAIAAVDGREELYRVRDRGRARAAAAATLPALPARPRGGPPRARRRRPAGALGVARRRGHGACCSTCCAAAAPRRPGGTTLVAPVAAGDEHLGALVATAVEPPFGQEADELLRAVANQLAVALQKAELIERLTAENIVRDLFEALAERRRRDVAEARARAAGCDLDRRHVAAPRRAPRRAAATRGRGRRSPSAPRRALRRLAPGALCDAGPREPARAGPPLRAGSDDAGPRGARALGAARRRPSASRSA